MILLAASGSTKTEWCLVNDDGIIERYLTDEINPYFQSRREISHIVRLQLPPIFFKLKISTTFFYGAGFSSSEKKNIVKASLEAQFRTPAIIESDLLGAARALFGNQPGIGCILSTGSNSCFYDGESIVKNIRPLGYILGDEGSSTSLGKVFLADCLKGLAPPELSLSFFDKYGIDPDQILDYIYSKPSPNVLLSLLSNFLYEYLEHPYVKNLIYENLKSFFVRNIMQYDYTNYPVRFVGSLAGMYASQLKQIADELDIKVDLILENPMHGLIAYHKSKGRL
ncbi:N-acetylglucosamine kinase-like BadF-type ATPase [Dysgonomonas alginatilytica]|uniref:N-acetylglucosamine kinase-like BadF-type ATPase n=1 Tax=Dysgonomonas alginatilytica TaxID=1605892 RepID=A0A2V3PMX1_9BACT|nr:hypothetical protein [Dysgonomonas alginatilytica]PXV62122.1 N-acetylglucosamine kinase-like BadF-type ATPase [Dysgonomonas alginatilytica]